jgi:CHAD domain-containing protein
MSVLNKPRKTLERELKLDVDSGFVFPALSGESLELRVLTSTYFDTADRRLLSVGITLRRRVERRKGLWQLKLPRGAARLELEAPGGPSGPPSELAALLVGVQRGQELAPVARMRTRRAGVRVVADGRGVAEVVLDRVSVLDGRRVASTFVELEAELLDGVPATALISIGETLRQAGARSGGGQSKLARVLGVKRRSQPCGADPAAVQLQAALATQFGVALSNDPGVRLGDDPEDLHRLRVATQRLWVILRVAQPLVFAEQSESLRAELDWLDWLGSRLGPVRDLDVLLARFTGEARTLELDEQRAFRRLLHRLEGERALARAALLETLEGERYFRLLDALETVAATPFALDADASLSALAAGEFAKLRKAVNALGPLPTDRDLHRMRIKGKRARYSAELAEPAGGKPLTRFIAAAKAFQDVIGEHHDAVVAEERLKTLAAKSSGVAAFAAGRLVEVERVRKEAARKAFPTAWAKLDKRGRRAL